MPHPSSRTCTIAAPASPAAAQPQSPLPAAKRHGNPNLVLIPRCGARTHAGCPCRVPSAHGKPRCPVGQARGRVERQALDYLDRLPPEFAVRLGDMPGELLKLLHPARGLTQAEDRAMRRAEAEALAPWKQAIAPARQAARAGCASSLAPSGPLAAAQPRPLAPERVAGTGPAAPLAASAPAPAEPLAPIRPGATRTAPAPARFAAQPKPCAPERATGAAATGPTAAPAAPAPAQAEPLAPIPPGATRSAPARFAAQPKSHAPERATGATATGPAAAPAAPPPAQAEPLAPIRPAATGTAPAPARFAAQPKPHAPERATGAAATSLAAPPAAPAPA